MSAFAEILKDVPYFFNKRPAETGPFVYCKRVYQYKIYCVKCGKERYTNEKLTLYCSRCGSYPKRHKDKQYEFNGRRYRYKINCVRCTGVKYCDQRKTIYCDNCKEIGKRQAHIPREIEKRPFTANGKKYRYMIFCNLCSQRHFTNNLSTRFCPPCANPITIKREIRKYR
jgi:hypothetical protein